MRLEYLVVISALFIFAFSAGAGATDRFSEEPRFFSSIQDMPLMPGLTELPDQSVTFDKPEGRIIESVAEIDSLAPGDIRRYYEAALPQLGWSRIAENAFVRQNERLQLSFENYENQQFMRVMISPRR